MQKPHLATWAILWGPLSATINGITFDGYNN